MTIYNWRRVISWRGLFIVAFALLISGPAWGQLKYTPQVSIKYNYNDNIDGVEPGGKRPLVTAQYLDYLVGGNLTYKASRSTFSIAGYVGYEQYLTMEGQAETRADTSPADYNFMTLSGNVLYVYSMKRFSLELSDRADQTRNLQDVFGAGTDALSYRYLYLHNTAGVGVRMGIGPKDRLLVRYQYESLVFATPENRSLRNSKPADSFESRVQARNEYDISPKITAIVDLQWANRTFEEIKSPFTGQNDKAANYIILIGYGGLRYHFTNNAYLEALAGAAQRTFYDLSSSTLPSPPFAAGSKAYDLQDYTEPVGMIIFVATAPKRYTLQASLEHQVSIYGQNLFFTYTGANVNYTYYFTPKLSFNLGARYYQALFDLDRNGRQWLWKENRTDNVSYLNANLHYDILQKGGEGTLSVEGGWALSMRDSSINGQSDYNPLLIGVYPPDALGSYDTQVNTYYIQVQMVPTILLGN